MNTKTYAWAALGLSLIVPNALVSGEYSYGSKEVYESTGVAMFDETPYTVDLYGGGSTVYNSNTTQLSDGTSAWVAIFDFGFDVESGNQGGRGFDYGFGYDGAVYWWDNTTAAADRDPFEHRLDGYVQVSGGKTRFRIGSDFYRNNGNAMDFVNANREARSAQSNEWGVNASLVRDLSRGSFEVGAAYNMRDFDAGPGLNDQDGYLVDFALFHRFAGAPKTSYGVGFRFGSDDSSGNVDQDFHTTSIRWRYQASSKTSAFSSLGLENRSRPTGTGRSTATGDVDNFVFDAGFKWQVSPKTGLDLYVTRNVRPSYFGVNSDYESLAGVAQVSHNLPGLYTLDARVGFENAEYNNGREDDFLRLGLSVSRPVSLSQGLNGSVSVFYNYNENDSSETFVNFDQTLAGVRFGLVY